MISIGFQLAAAAAFAAICLLLAPIAIVIFAECAYIDLKRLLEKMVA